MSEVKHTPGPWNFLFTPSPEEVEVLVVPPNESSHDGWLSKTVAIGSPSNEVLAEVKAYTTSGFLQDFNQWEANAKLIAAAPDLLEALQDMVKDFWRNYNESEKSMFRASYPKSNIVKAESAIKKATS